MNKIFESGIYNQVYPIILNPKNHDDQIKLDLLLQNNNIKVVNTLDNQIIELLNAKSGGKKINSDKHNQLLKEFYEVNDKDTFGNWIYYPWKNTLVRLLPEEDFILVRTSRNNYKITQQEQKELATRKVGIIGLSVGQSIALAMALERSFGELRISDFDTLDLSNINRLRASIIDLNEEKSIIAAREIWEIDPYLNIKLFREGISEENIDDFLTSGGKLDLLIDECDSFNIKVLAREKAKKYKIPVVMETSDRGMVDIERFDLEPDRPIFHGHMKGVSYSDLKELSDRQRIAIGLKITGINTLSSRMKASLLEMNQTITSWPQLASAVFLGGATISHIARKLLLGANYQSGKCLVDIDELVKPEENSQVKEVEKEAISFSDWMTLIPNNLQPSSVNIPQNDLRDIIEHANMAPSGGNVQPWHWILDEKSIIHLFHDKTKSDSFLDFLGTGSLIAFGAALENLRLKAAYLGYEIEIIHQINEFEQDLIASIRFISKSPLPLKVKYSELVEGISKRCTNRKNNERVEISDQVISEMENLVTDLELGIKSKTDDKSLQELARIIGEMDRLRLLHKRGYRDFINEIRWTEKEAIDTSDGIDIETLELEGADRAALGLLRDAAAVELLRENNLGTALSKISDTTVLSSSAVVMIQGASFDPITYLKAGIALQRIWIKANLNDISIQPISASLFIFQRLKREITTGYSKLNQERIIELSEDLNKLFNDGISCENLFLIRLNKVQEPSVRAYRRDVSNSLTII
ncbi:Rv1355c family protein [Algoriphagus pacificus]|uniref:Rv1355c family protein n=1 Tax=Algoriphagus pacificus TaxID=2811234 RepID=A0ABS3CLM9_9BACT|nr:Rv1355c family protein [Algoriphagus pacificus]MBN7817937.1 Rv1355c family protein [Algoriphagus pacificus]